MNPIDFFKRPAPAPLGNPAHPSIEERERLIAKNIKQDEKAVKKIPADELPRPAKD